MKALSRQWIEMAEGDWATANRGVRSRTCPTYASACYAAAQCAERYLKAVLTEAGVEFNWGCKLAGTLDHVLANCPELAAIQESAQRLSDAYKYQYPPHKADKSTATAALNTCKAIRRHIREHFGLSESADSPGRRRAQRRRAVLTHP